VGIKVAGGDLLLYKEERNNKSKKNDNQLNQSYRMSHKNYMATKSEVTPSTAMKFQPKFF